MWTVDALALLVNKVKEKLESLFIPTKVSDLANDAGYVNSSALTDWTFTPNNTSTLTSQIDALPANGIYSFYILSYGHQSATDMPTNENYYGLIYRGSANYVTVVAYVVGKSVEHYRTKTNGTWGSWT